MQLDATGLPVGLLTGVDRRCESIALPAVCKLLMYTDGMTEAVNPEEMEFGIQRLKDGSPHFRWDQRRFRIFS